MTFSAVGTIIHAQSSTFSLTPGTVGDFILIEVLQYSNNTVTATALSSSNVTWATLGSSFAGTTNTWTTQVFIGTVTATSAQTVTVTWSGATPANILIAGQEFSSTVGAASVTLDVQGHIDSAGTSNWASLTPGHGAGELYFGFAGNLGSAVAGSTSGYVYQNDPANNGMAYNVNCPNSATFPVWGDAHQALGIMVLVYEASGAGPAGSVQPRATVPVPRRRPSRGLWQGITGQSFVAVAAPRQQYRTPPRRVLARVVWRGGSGQSYVKVPAPRQPPYLPPRRKPGRAVVPGRPPRGLPAVFVAVPAPRRLPPVPRRVPARAYVRFTPVATVNAPPAPPAVGAPAHGDYERNRLGRRRHILPRAAPLLVIAPPAIEAADGWPGVWPGPWPEPAPPAPEPEPVYIPAPEPEPVPPPRPPRAPVYTRPPKIPRKYPEHMDSWRKR